VVNLASRKGCPRSSGLPTQGRRHYCINHCYNAGDRASAIFYSIYGKARARKYRQRTRRTVKLYARFCRGQFTSNHFQDFGRVACALSCSDSDLDSDKLATTCRNAAAQRGWFGSEPRSEPEPTAPNSKFGFRFGGLTRTGPSAPFKVRQTPEPLSNLNWQVLKMKILSLILYWNRPHLRLDIMGCARVYQCNTEQYNTAA
jgi:hypothetical protein